MPRTAPRSHSEWQRNPIYAYVVVLGSVVSHVSQNGVKYRHYLHRFPWFKETVTKRPVIYTVFRAWWWGPYNLVPNKRFRRYKMYPRRRFVPQKRFRRDKTANPTFSHFGFPSIPRPRRYVFSWLSTPPCLGHHHVASIVEGKRHFWNFHWYISSYTALLHKNSNVVYEFL